MADGHDPSRVCHVELVGSRTETSHGQTQSRLASLSARANALGAGADALHAEDTLAVDIQALQRTMAAEVKLAGAAAKESGGAVRAALGRLSALSVFHRKSFLYGAFVWAHRALNRPKRRFPARAGSESG